MIMVMLQGEMSLNNSFNKNLLMSLRLKFIYLLLFSCLLLTAQTRRALVIGLGQQEDRSWQKINGDKDVPLIIDMLKNAGYHQKDIISLVNEQATKQGIVMAFKKLTNLCKQNDIVYIHFSGHGQRVTDVDGDETNGWDESWIPYDAYRKYGNMDKGEKHLIDDEIYTFLMDIKQRIGNGGKILVVVDACHGGGSTFGIESFCYGLELTTRGGVESFIIPILGKRVSNVPKSPERWLTLSACKSFQLNQELSNPRAGILSYALYSISQKGSIKMELIEDFIRNNKGPLEQTPILTGETNKYKISDILK